MTRTRTTSQRLNKSVVADSSRLNQSFKVVEPVDRSMILESRAKATQMLSLQNSKNRMEKKEKQPVLLLASLKSYMIATSR